MEIGYGSKNCTKHAIRNVSFKKPLYFSGLLLWIMQEYIMRTKYLDFFGYAPCTVLRIIALTLLVSKITFLDTKYSVKLFCFSIVCCMIMIISQFTLNSESSSTMLNVLIICMAARDIDVVEMCSFNFWVSGSAWIFTVLSAYVGIVDNDYIWELLRIRYFLGFDYVFFPPIYLINIIFAVFYAYTTKKGKSVSWVWIAVAAMLNLWIYKKTITRLAFVIVKIFLMLYVLAEKLKMNILKYSSFDRYKLHMLFSSNDYLDWKGGAFV